LPFVYQDAVKFSESGFSHFDDSAEVALGLHNNSVISQQRSVEGAPEGTKLEYEEN
jgi:hypothetical protein